MCGRHLTYSIEMGCLKNSRPELCVYGKQNRSNRRAATNKQAPLSLRLPQRDNRTSKTVNVVKGGEQEIFLGSNSFFIAAGMMELVVCQFKAKADDVRGSSPSWTTWDGPRPRPLSPTVNVGPMRGRERLKIYCSTTHMGAFDLALQTARRHCGLLQTPGKSHSQEGGQVDPNVLCIITKSLVAEYIRSRRMSI